MDGSEAESGLLPKASRDEAWAILGAMRAVAEAGGAELSDADRRALAAAHRYIFRGPDPLDVSSLLPVEPAALASALSGGALARDAVKFLTVMAFVDGTLDRCKIGAVMAYAAALGVEEAYLDEVRDAAAGHLQQALADMSRRNIESITERPWPGGDPAAWLLPYANGKADPALVARFEGLATLPDGSFGRAFWSHFKDNGYAFPGDPQGLNAVFSLPHDSAHVLTGYDTTTHGELLVSTFTATMHRHEPMAGHVLPVIFSWQLGDQINAVAGGGSGALDPEAFWEAWAAGARSPVDTFSPGWDFWREAGRPLAAVRGGLAIPPEGLSRTAAAPRAATA